MRIKRQHSFLIALVLGVGACSNDAVQSAQGPVSRVLMTDGPFPFDRVARVDLYVVTLSASLNPDTSATAGGDFITIASPHRLINVLALQNGATTELGTVTLPKGAITAVRLVIDTDSSSITLRDGRVLTATSNPGIRWQSSAGRPVLNALLMSRSWSAIPVRSSWWITTWGKRSSRRRKSIRAAPTAVSSSRRCFARSTRCGAARSPARCGRIRLAARPSRAPRFASISALRARPRTRGPPLRRQRRIQTGRSGSLM